MLIYDFQIIGPKKTKVLKVCLCACARAASPRHQRIAVLFCVRSRDRLWGRQPLTSHALLCLTFPVVKPFTLICKIKRKSSSVIFEIQVLKTRYGCYCVFRYFIKKKSQLPVFKAVKCSVVDQRAK